MPLLHKFNDCVMLSWKSPNNNERLFILLSSVLTRAVTNVNAHQTAMVGRAQARLAQHQCRVELSQLLSAVAQTNCSITAATFANVTLLVLQLDVPKVDVTQKRAASDQIPILNKEKFLQAIG